MEFKKILALSGLFFTLEVHAVGGYTDVYACDSCNFETAKTIAISKTPSPDCAYDQDNGQPVFDDNLVCTNVSSVFIVANPITRAAWKFKVTGTVYGDEINHMNLESHESRALDRYYQIESEFVNATESGVFLSYDALSSNAASPDVSHSAIGSASDDTSCDKHPSDFFKNETRRKAYLSALTSTLATDLGSSSWSDYWSDSRVTGIGISAGMANMGISITREYIDHQAYGTLSFGDSHNKLVFRLGYAGSDADDNLKITYQLDYDFSRVDGYELSVMFKPSGEDTFLQPGAVSTCLIDFVEGRDVGYQSSGNVSVPGVSMVDANASFGGLRLCRYTRTGLTSIAGAGGEPKVSVMSWISACNN